MNIVGIIPARMGSTRFPNKPLAKILGIPMIGHCSYRTSIALDAARTYVATCDNEIVTYMNDIGGNVILTASTHKRATTRCAEAVDIIEQKSGQVVDIVVMVQGDEPLVQPIDIQDALNQFADPTVNIVNIMIGLYSRESFLDKNNVKVVINNDSNALYYSREAIPSLWQEREERLGFMQTGIIAFRRDTLLKFNDMPETPLEKIESVDMNRVLENGGNIRMVESNSPNIGVDTEEELMAVENIMKDDRVYQQYSNIS